MHRPRQHTSPEQQLLFPVKPHTHYTRAVERLIEKMRHGFLELPDLERRLTELGIFEGPEEIDMLWSHMIYGNSPMPDRDHVMGHLWHPILRMLDTLNREGPRALSSEQKLLFRHIIHHHQQVAEVVDKR
ncbi:hypothetical protein AUJ46_03240 [Candidatus Peregrinibacteria bacterium CG1_02_54_53]|nr:MAG: hypothetical protein AUJ46_03240 [Candidatus Peregrinibacteria bacterium CG1_02_54_53]